MTVGRLLVIQVYKVYFLEDTPVHATTVVVGNAVRSKVCHFHFDEVFPRMKIFAYKQTERCRPSHARFMTVDSDAGTFAYIAEIENPFIGVDFRKNKRQRIEPRPAVALHIREGKRSPRHRTVDSKSAVNCRFAADETQVPAMDERQTVRLFAIIVPRRKISRR